MLKSISLRRKVLNIIGSYRTYLSDEFKCANGLEGIRLSTLLCGDETSSKANLGGLRVEQMLSNRLQSFSTETNSLEDVQVLSHVLIDNYTSQNNVNDLITLLQSPRKYGIFLDDYTCCYLLNYLFSSKEFDAAARVAIISMFYGNIQSRLAKVMIMQALYVCTSSEPFRMDEINEAANEYHTSENAVLVRGYIRNLNNSKRDQDGHYVFGKLLVGLTNKTEDKIQMNLYVLGLVLMKRYEDAIEFLRKNSQLIYKDVLQKALQVAENDKTSSTELITSIKNAINEITSPINDLFEEAMSSLIKEVAEEQQYHMIENQKISYQKWLANVYDKLNLDKRKKDADSRLKNVNAMYENLKSREELIRFFENFDYYDLQIAKKNNTFYPKRWFGKKKKPRAIDSKYVPPEIRRMNN